MNNLLYPRLKIRRSMSKHVWYVVVMIDKYDGQLIRTGMTFNQARRLVLDLERAVTAYFYAYKKGLTNGPQHSA
jgi:hypothetical protein